MSKYSVISNSLFPNRMKIDMINVYRSCKLQQQQEKNHCDKIAFVHLMNGRVRA